MNITIDSPSETMTGSSLKFFLLVFVLTIPFWLVSSLTQTELMLGLPVAAFAVVCPLIAAVILTYRQNKMTGVVALLKRSFDLKKVHKGWWIAPALLLTPLIAGLAFIFQRATGTGIPDLQIKLIPTLMLFLLFFVGAISEELGWSGYALDPLQARWGMLRAGLILGVVWAVWHYIPLAQAHRSVEWVAWWSLGTVSARIIMVWLYNNTGKSVFITALFHVMINLTWQLYPVNGSYFDPRISGIISALIVVIIIFIWEPRTLARYRSP